MAWYTPLKNAAIAIKNHPYKTLGFTATLLCAYQIGKFVERNYEQRIDSVVQIKDINGDGLQPDIGITYNERVIPAYLTKERDKWLTKEGMLKKYTGLDKLVNKPYTETKSENERQNPMSEPLPITDSDKPSHSRTDSSQKHQTFEPQQQPASSKVLEAPQAEIRAPVEKTAQNTSLPLERQLTQVPPKKQYE